VNKNLSSARGEADWVCAKQIWRAILTETKTNHLSISGKPDNDGETSMTVIMDALKERNHPYAYQVSPTDEV